MTLHAVRVRLKLSDSWYELLLTGSDQRRQSIENVIAVTVGSDRRRAVVRTRLRRELSDAVSGAADAGADSMHIGFAVPGLRVPMTLTLFDRPEIRMSTAVGSSPSAVLESFRSSMHEVDPLIPRRIVVVPSVGGPTLRVVEVTSNTHDPAVSGLIVQYWFPIPNTKQLSLALFHAPLISSEKRVLAVTDKIIGRTQFERSNEDAAVPHSVDTAPIAQRVR